MRPQRLLLESLSFNYWPIRRLFELLVLVGRSDREKEIEILLPSARVAGAEAADPSTTPANSRSRGARGALPQVLPRARQYSFLVQPATLLRWHRELIRQRGSLSVASSRSKRSRCGSLGEPSVQLLTGHEALELRSGLAKIDTRRVDGWSSSPDHVATSGSSAIHKPGITVSATLVRNMLTRAGTGGEKGHGCGFGSV
jgi:hypothetical protein